MSEIIMVGCDLHDKTMLLKVAQAYLPQVAVKIFSGFRRRL